VPALIAILLTILVPRTMMQWAGQTNPLIWRDVAALMRRRWGGGTLGSVELLPQTPDRRELVAAITGDRRGYDTGQRGHQEAAAVHHSMT
jgi:hypothetical protein